MQKRIEHARKLLLIHLCLHLGLGRCNISKLGYCFNRMPTALLAVLLFITIDGKIARDPAKIRTQDGRIGRRNGVPGAQPRVIHAFLAILHIVQNVLRDARAIRAVFCVGLHNCLLISLIVQFNDQLILHVLAPFVVSLPYHTTFFPDPDIISKKFWKMICF